MVLAGQVNAMRGGRSPPRETRLRLPVNRVRQSPIPARGVAAKLNSRSAPWQPGIVRHQQYPSALLGALRRKPSTTSAFPVEISDDSS